MPVILKILPFPTLRERALPEIQRISDSNAVNDENISSHHLLSVIINAKPSVTFKRVNRKPTDAHKLLFCTCFSI